MIILSKLVSATRIVNLFLSISIIFQNCFMIVLRQSRTSLHTGISAATVWSYSSHSNQLKLLDTSICLCNPAHKFSPNDIPGVLLRRVHSESWGLAGVITVPGPERRVAAGDRLIGKYLCWCAITEANYSNKEDWQLEGATSFGSRLGLVECLH